MPNVVDRNIIETLILASAPEKQTSLKALWKKYEPHFILTEDKQGLTFKAGNDYVAFDHKTLRHDWLLGFAAWRAFCCYGPFILLSDAYRLPLSPGMLLSDPNISAEEERLQDLTYTAAQLSKAAKAEDVPWPAGVPEPQAGSSGLAIQDRATFELLCIGTGASFLHELAHVRFAREGDRPLSVSEERDCDQFARQFITSDVQRYATSTANSVDDVLTKRAMGLAITAYIIHQQTPSGSHKGSDTHPPSAERFNILVGAVPVAAHSFSWVFAAAIVLSILRHNKTFASDIPFQTPKDLFGKLTDFLNK